jgi:Family of unknown function (DUF6134)
MVRLACLPSIASRTVTAFLAAVVLALPPTAVQAAGVDVRDFSVIIDGKPAGDYRMTIRQEEDGTVTMTGRSETRVTVLGFTAYSFSYQGEEVWKAGRLQRFESSGAENGKRYSVSAALQGDRLRITANGQSFTASPEVWVNTYWHLPAAEIRGQEVPLLGCDTGKESTALLQQYAGVEKIGTAGRVRDCVHYRIMTNPPHDLWYDSQERLVRQEWVADGHRTVLEMVRQHR